MANVTKNKLASQLIKAEMLGDKEAVARLKGELAKLSSDAATIPKRPIAESSSKQLCRPSPIQQNSGRRINATQPSKNQQLVYPKVDNRIKKFIESTSSLDQMFVQEKSITAADEAKMFAKTAAKFSRDNMETGNFSEEIDDSQLVLNRSNKRHKQDISNKMTLNSVAFAGKNSSEQELCDRCLERQAKHLVIDKTFEFIYMTLTDAKPFLSRMSNVIIRNNDHSCSSFISASEDHQVETEKLIDFLREGWKSKGYRCIIMETFFKNRRPRGRETFVSCGQHFQVHCLPIKEKHFERARMYFKQALQESEKEWSMNRKLIQTDERRIQRYIPKGLSYFWVCFDDLKNGFGHVIEMEQDFSRFFGLEVLSGLLDKDFNPMKLNEREEFKEQFERSRDFKLLYSEFKPI